MIAIYTGVNGPDLFTITTVICVYPSTDGNFLKTSLQFVLV